MANKTGKTLRSYWLDGEDDLHIATIVQCRNGINNNTAAIQWALFVAAKKAREEKQMKYQEWLNSLPQERKQDE